MLSELSEKNLFNNDNPEENLTPLDDIKPKESETGTEPEPKPDTETESESRVSESQEREVSLEEKVQVIKDFIDSEFDEGKLLFRMAVDATGEITKKRAIVLEALKGQFKDKSFSEIRKDLGDETIVLIQKVISVYNQGINEIRAQNIIDKREDVRELAEKQMIPIRLNRILRLPGSIISYLMYLYLKEDIDNILQQEEDVKKIRKEFEDIEKNIFPETREKKSISIKGFEKFDCPEVKGEEFVKQALQYLPQKPLGKEVKEIRYEDRKTSMLEGSGIDEDAAAYYYVREGKIVFFKSDKSKKEFLEGFRFNLAHEGGHALDPRTIPQEGLSILEEIQIIKEWEQVRVEEEEFSDYVKKIDNKDKIIENKIKSEESFAETIRMFLLNPGHLQDNNPKRFEFCEKWLNKQFPEENFTKIEQFENRSYYSRAVQLYFQYKELLEKL